MKGAYIKQKQGKAKKFFTKAQAVASMRLKLHRMKYIQCFFVTVRAGTAYRKI